jgi:hypothetical protein
MSVKGHQRRFERAPATSASPPIPDILLSRSKSAGVFMRAIGAMIAPLSDHWRWGINAGASLGHHHARAIIGDRCGLRAHTTRAEACCARPMMDAADLRSLCLLSRRAAGTRCGAV